MTAFPFRFEILGAEHDRAEFHCGEEVLDLYLQRQATQDIRRRIANCFVAIETATGRLAAFYTLSAASISVVDLAPEDTKGLRRYPTLPAVRIGRLALDERFQKRGLGMSLLLNAADRIMHSPPAAFTLLVDAKNDQAAAFYRRHGFRPLMTQPLTLYLPLATAHSALRVTVR